MCQNNNKSQTSEEIKIYVKIYAKTSTNLDNMKSTRKLEPIQRRRKIFAVEEDRYSIKKTIHPHSHKQHEEQQTDTTSR